MILLKFKKEAFKMKNDFEALLLESSGDQSGGKYRVIYRKSGRRFFRIKGKTIEEVKEKLKKYRKNLFYATRYMEELQTEHYSWPFEVVISTRFTLPKL